MPAIRPLLRISLLLAAVIAGSGCAAKGDCRDADKACAQTSDCCEGLACFNGLCAAPAVCPTEAPIDCGNAIPGMCCQNATPYCCAKSASCTDTAATCNGPTCSSADRACVTSATCCTGLTCQAKVCAKPPVGAVCGNGKCEAGESQGTCCSDCGCPAGTTCQSNQCKAPTGTVLNWSITDSCFNGENVEVRFFAVDRGLVWPGGNLVYTMAPGTTITQPLACNLGEKICFGADQPINGLAWGVDIDNSIACADCCRTCANASVSYGPLTCR